MVTQSLYTKKLSVSEETKNLIVDQCKKEFIRHHPELEGMRVTENMLVLAIAKFYLNIKYSDEAT